MYEYPARVSHIVDGDTYDMVFDLGFKTHKQARTRLLDVDTHETWGAGHDTEEYKRGIEEVKFVEEWFDRASHVDSEWPVIVRSESWGKYGRVLAIIERRLDGEILNERLLEEFDGVAYE